MGQDRGGSGGGRRTASCGVPGGGRASLRRLPSPVTRSSGEAARLPIVAASVIGGWARRLTTEAR